MDALQQLTSSSLSLLHTTNTHSSPFPPAPRPHPSALLATARQLNLQLTDQLQQAHINATAARKAASAIANSRGETHSEGEQHSREEQEQLSSRIEELTRQVDEMRGKKSVREGIVDALNHSYAINSHLSRPAISSSTAQTQRDAETAHLLHKRDALALQLLHTQSASHKLTQARLSRRRRLLELNRQNATLANRLKETTAEPERKAVEGMSSAERKAWDRLQAETKRQLSGHAIIRNVFQLVVVESGVGWYDGADFPSFLVPAQPSSSRSGDTTMADHPTAEDEEQEQDDPEAPMDTKRLLRLMLLAGEAGGGR